MYRDDPDLTNFFESNAMRWSDAEPCQCWYLGRNYNSNVKKKIFQKKKTGKCKVIGVRKEQEW